MKIQKVTDPAFRRYGKVLEGYNFGPLLKEMKHTPVPEDVVYVPSAEELEALDVEKELKNRAFGGLPVQIGYCNGHNKKLNATEYHRNSEINVAVTDLVLLIGHQQDIEEDLYIRYLKGGGISGTGRNRDRGLCNNSPLCTMSCE